jgi:endonuclease YncB( thermonuclease family)
MIARALAVAFLVLATAQSRAAELIVADGDTLVLNGTPIRLDGIDAPQTDQTCLDRAGAVWRCGIAARDQLEKHIAKRTVRCDDAGADTVYKKRRIGVCWVEGETANLNQWLVREGWALNLEPAAKGRFTSDRDYARDNRKGLWSGCFVSPQTLRRWNQSVAKLLGAACPEGNDWKARNVLFPERPTMPPGCTIKGKAAARALMFGSRGIYHLGACRSYTRTKAPDRWFCSEDEAKADGFRKSHTC